MASYDVIIIGAGPGGYVCAIRCAQLGLKTAVVEGRETLGGTCLNVGCIPSKALLHASHSLHEAEHNFAKMGLKGKSPSVDWNQMKAYKDDVIGQNTGGVEFLMKKNKIDWLKGWASIPAAGQVKVGDDVHEAKNIVIASGSVPSSLPGVEVDNDKGIVVDSTGALELPKVPKKMVVIGEQDKLGLLQRVKPRVSRTRRGEGDRHIQLHHFGVALASLVKAVIV